MSGVVLTRFKHTDIREQIRARVQSSVNDESENEKSGFWEGMALH